MFRLTEKHLEQAKVEDLARLAKYCELPAEVCALPYKTKLIGALIRALKLGEVWPPRLQQRRW